MPTNINISIKSNLKYLNCGNITLDKLQQLEQKLQQENYTIVSYEYDNKQYTNIDDLHKNRQNLFDHMSTITLTVTKNDHESMITFIIVDTLSSAVIFTKDSDTADLGELYNIMNELFEQQTSKFTTFAVSVTASVVIAIIIAMIFTGFVGFAIYALVFVALLFVIASIVLSFKFLTNKFLPNTSSSNKD